MGIEIVQRRRRNPDIGNAGVAGSTAQQIHHQLRESGAGVGLTTVYRSLAMMAESGEVDVLLADDGEARYRACSSEHHHHLVCRSCGYTGEVKGPQVERGANRTAGRCGFSEVTHTVEIHGLCDTCATRAGEARTDR